MLTILTGLPGASKTCYLLARLIKEYAGRQVYTYNVEGIDHEYFGTIPIQDVQLWYELPAGAVIFIDEAQGFFPVRKTGAVVPPWCAAFETHRHNGHDVVVVTQDASLLDVHLRKLAGRHLHIFRLYGSKTASVLEYDKYQGKPQDKNIMKTAVSNKTWTFDKSVFDHYHSAEVHTVKRKIPFKLIMVPVIAVVSLTAMIGVFFLLKGMVTGDSEMLSAALAGEIEPGETATAAALPGNSLHKWIYERTPLVPGMPWTSPMYSSVQEVVTFPRPWCLVVELDAFQTSCKCFSQQLTLMPTVSQPVCRQIATMGLFDYTKEERSGGEDRAPRERTQDVSRKQLPRASSRPAEYVGHSPVVVQAIDSNPGRALRARARINN